jgi:uncharacterized delta-60 repeat protein
MTLARTSRRICHHLRVELLEGRTLLNAGALDTSFGGTGQVLTQLANNSFPQELAVQADLKTVVAAQEGPPGALFDLAVIRSNVDGTLDSTFGSGGVVQVATNSIQGQYTLHNAAVAIQPDGKIVVATNAATGTPTSITSCDMLVLRFNTDGSLDGSFGQNGEADIHFSQGMTAANAIAVLPSGQIVVAGSNIDGQIGPEFVVARLTSSGALDTNFGPNGQGYNYTIVTPTVSLADKVGALGVDASGNLVVGGSWATPSGAFDLQIVRYTPGGMIDTSFGSQGVDDLPGIWPGVNSIGFQSSGRLRGLVENLAEWTTRGTAGHPRDTRALEV